MPDQTGLGDQTVSSVKEGLKIFPLLVVLVALFFPFNFFIIFCVFFFVIAPILQPYSNRRRAQINRRRRKKQ